MQLIIVGFHRSGTSLMTRLLNGAGLHVGDDLLGARPTNPYGHYEDRDIVRLHRNILEAHGTDWQWDAPFPFFISQEQWHHMRRLARRRDLEHRDWGFKDPRVCLFLGAWKHVLPDAKFVVVYRDPGECVRSLESRQAADHFRGEGDSDAHLRFFREPDHGLRLWDAYNRAVVAFTRAHRRDCLVLPFTDVMSSPDVIARVNKRFGSRLEEIDTSSLVDTDIVNRRVAPQAVHAPDVAFRVGRTWDALETLAAETAVSL